MATKAMLLKNSLLLNVNVVISEVEAKRLLCYFKGKNREIIKAFKRFDKDFIIGQLMEWEHDVLGEEELKQGWTKYQYWRTKYPYWEEQRFKDYVN